MGVGYLAASFDLLNVGNLDVISQAGSRCGELVVGVFSDELVEDLTGRPPVVPLGERLALVQHVRGVQEAVVHEPGRARVLGADVVFSVADDPAPAVAGAVALTPARQTSSAALRAALRPAVDEAVA